MSEHTPGPWKAYCRSVNHKDGEPWPKDQFLQWGVSGPDVPDGRGDFYEADARLIAAAPDLLAALKGMLAIVSDSRGVTGYHLNGDEALWAEFPEVDAARAAIAKAEAGRGEG